MAIVYTVLLLLFLVAVDKWLRFEFPKKTVVLSSRLKWWAGLACASAFVGYLLDEAVGGNPGNFLLHGIGGGVAGTFAFIYLIERFRFRAQWRLLSVALFMFVSTLGVMNELAEYAAELVHFSVFSVDSHDTWRDFVANTTGAGVAWVMYLASRPSVARKRPQR